MKIKSGICAFLFTGFVLLLGFYIGGMFPFGSGTLSWCDMNQQAIPLLCDFKDILEGKNGLFLNTANASGMNFYGVFFFFLSSPFSFLVGFVDKADVPFLMNILVVLKLCLAAFTAAYSFGKMFPKLGSGLNTVFGVSYALCGYGMLFYQNIMWLDIMYLFPVVAVGIYKLIKEDKPTVLVLSLSACVVLNYYISFMVFLSVIVFFGILALFYRNADRKIYVNLGLCGILSLLATAVVWVPSFMQYTSSGRGSGIFAELTGSSFFAPTDTTVPVLLCSGIIFAILFFVVPKLSSAEKNTKFFCILFLSVAIPLVIEPVNLMWHTGSYMSFPARYGFITVYAGLLIVANELSSAEYLHTSNKKFAIILTSVALSMAIFMVTFADKNAATLSSYVQTLWGNENSFKGLILLCSFAVATYFTVLLCLKKKFLSKRIAAFLLCLVVAAEGLCSVRIYMVTAKDKLNLYNYQSFLSLSDNVERDGFYRVNTSHKLIDANMTGAAGFNSISHYTSLNDRTAMETAKQLGYSGYWMETGNWDGSIISDALLSVGYTVTTVAGNFEIRENPYFLGLGIKSEGEILKNLSHNDRLMSLGKAFAQLTGSENAVTKYEPLAQENCSYYKTENNEYIISAGVDGKITYKISVKDRQTLYFDCYNGFSNNLTEEINNSFQVYVNGEQLTKTYPTQRQNGLLKIGSFENTEVDITLNLLEDVECSSFGVFGIFEDKVTNAIENVECLNLTAEKGKIAGDIKQSGKYFISLPYSSNYNITLNGKKIEYTQALSGFIAIETDEIGEIKICSAPKGFVVGAVVSILGIAVMILFVIFGNRVIIDCKKFKNIVYGVFLGVFAIVVAMVYIIPVIVNLSDFRM